MISAARVYDNLLCLKILFRMPYLSPNNNLYFPKMAHGHLHERLLFTRLETLRFLRVFLLGSSESAKDLCRKVENGNKQRCVRIKEGLQTFCQKIFRQTETFANLARTFFATLKIVKTSYSRQCYFVCARNVAFVIIGRHHISWHKRTSHRGASITQLAEQS